MTTQSFSSDVLLEEVNILRLEGRIFCFDSGLSKKQTDPVVYDDGNGRTITIEPHPRYGRPSIGAFKILQAIFKKITDEGLPIADTLCFSEREIARLSGRESHGGRQSLHIRDYLMQLKTCNIKAHVFDKVTKEWQQADFSIITKVLSSGKGRKMHQCVVTIEPRIIESLNQRHWACFNWERLRQLSAIPMALYKRLHFHFSNIYNPHKMQPNELKFEKDYEAIVSEWFGGLTVQRFETRIKKQLGAHLDALKQTGLIKKWEVVRRADGQGFKLVFYPGKAFFEDYNRFYQSFWRPQLRLIQSADRRNIQEPHELVAYFHELLGHKHTSFEDKEIGYASVLLVDYSYDQVRDLISFVVAEARKSGGDPQFFGFVRQYIPRWEAVRAERAERAQQRQVSATCSHCNGTGFLPLIDQTSSETTMYPCPHDEARIQALEARTGKQRAI